jgi:protein phosphatase
VFEDALRIPAHRGHGVTATLVGLLGDSLEIVHIGDTRCYIARGGELVQVTRDDTLLEDAHRRGGIEVVSSNKDGTTMKKLAGLDHLPKHADTILTRVLGTQEHTEVSITTVALRSGDTLLLCSDGLTRMVDDSAILDALTTQTSPEDACNALVNAANAAGGHDNVTVIVAAFEGSSFRTASPEDRIPNLSPSRFTTSQHR